MTSIDTHQYFKSWQR